MTKEENQILKEAREFADLHKIPYDEKVELLILNAIRSERQNHKESSFDWTKEKQDVKLNVKSPVGEKEEYDASLLFSERYLTDAYKNIKSNPREGFRFSMNHNSGYFSVFVFLDNNQLFKMNNFAITESFSVDVVDRKIKKEK